MAIFKWPFTSIIQRMRLRRVNWSRVSPSESVPDRPNEALHLTGPALRLSEIQCLCSRPGNLYWSFADKALAFHDAHENLLAWYWGSGLCAPIAADPAHGVRLACDLPSPSSVIGISV